MAHGPRCPARTRGSILLLAAGLVLLAAAPAQAFHFPWDQGHRTFQPLPPEPPGPCEGGECRCDPCGQHSKGSPVYAATGDLVWTDTDVVLRGRPLLRLARTYNSHDPRDGPFGNGWSFDHDMTLIEVAATRPDGTTETRYVLRLPNGRRYVYRTSPGGSIANPPGLFNRLARNPDGSLTLTEPDGSTRVFLAGRLVRATDRNGNALDYAYDADGRLAAVSDAAGRRLEFSYDARGRIAAVTDHAGRTWLYDYDPDGNLVAVTDPLGGVRRYAYQPYTPPGDAHTYHQLVSVTDAAGATVLAVSYAGRRVARYTEAGRTWRYSYDPANRRLAKTDALGSTWRYAYNADGLVTAITDPLGSTTTIAYDANGLETSRTDPLGATWRTTWDARGRRLSATDPLGATTTWTYAGDSPFPVEIRSPTGRLTRITYDGRGNPVAVTDPAGHVTRLAYNARGDLVALTDALGAATRIEVDARGLPVAVTDPLGRVTRYEYDTLGRRIAVVNPAGERTTIAYDALDRVTAITDPLGQTVRFAYDPAGRLAAVTDPRGSTTRYEYDTAGRLLRRIAPDGRVTEYAYDPAGRLARITRPDGTAVTFAYDAAGRRLWYRANHQASVMALEDGTATTDTYAYSPYGITAATGTTPNDFRYTGREHEAGDLYYYRARYYDPTVGRFLSEDPIHFHGGTNLYFYGEDRPNQFIDPLGLDAYMCTKPLDAFGDLGKWAYDLGAPLLYHQYICVKAGGRTICGGQDRTGGPYSPGKPSRDYYNSARCEKVDDRPCVDRCLIEKIKNPSRPFYGLIGLGTNCQEWATDTFRECVARCEGR